MLAVADKAAKDATYLGGADETTTMTPTQRSLKLLRERGYMVAVVEKWNHYVKVRQDLFGIFDLLAVRGNETIGVQTTSGSNVAARVAKMVESDALINWKSETRGAVIHGWAKRGERGKRKTWTCREVEV